jgi:RimJ/RimL family protein N-acetyltransferase
MQGRYSRLEPILNERHFDDLWQAYSADSDGEIWAYLPYGPFADKDAFLKFARATYLGKDPMFHALIDARTGKALGVASLMRINADHGVIEVGHICYSPAAQRTPMTTEVIYLLGCRIFDELGYRRFEWKCNAANQASMRAAERFGFTFEGTFRQALVIKGENRDTAWFSIIDSEWPKLKTAFETWLDGSNFGETGQQLKSLNAVGK